MGATLYDIDIDGPIGPYFYSKEYVNSIVSRKQGKPLTVRVNSFGGSLNDALDISSRFHDHGDVTVHLFGFCASAATVLTLGAKKVCMDSNAFYLAHKVSNYVEICGFLNADDIDKAIEQLDKNRRENTKIDCQVAKMYAAKCHKTPEELANVMSASEWMTADEAMQLGLVDEVTNYDEPFKPSLLEKLNAFGLPQLPTESKPKTTHIDPIPKSLFNLLKETWTNKPKTFDMAGFSNLHQLLGELKFTMKDNCVCLPLESMERIEQRMESDLLKATELQNEITELNDLVAELKTQNEFLNKQTTEPTVTQRQQPTEEEQVTALDMYNTIRNYI